MHVFSPDGLPWRSNARDAQTHEDGEAEPVEYSYERRTGYAPQCQPKHVWFGCKSESVATSNEALLSPQPTVQRAVERACLTVAEGSRKETLKAGLTK